MNICSREESPVLLLVCSRLGMHLDVWRYTLRTALIT